MRASFLSALSLFGCVSTLDGSAMDVGGGGTAIPLPFPEGESARCTQGVGGSYSHAGSSTYYGIDLDTPNDADMEIYAPVGGPVAVHAESATSGFGYHASIALADGTFVVIAHLSEVLVEDGSEVAAGQLLGYEGCTGACSGDHVHLGLMEGDPFEMAQFAESVDVLVRVADMDEDDPTFAEIPASEFVCGTSGGHVYASDLAVARWHPNGTLAIVPNDPKVYLLEDGRARHVADESVFWSHNWNFDDLTYISDEELACFGTGEDIVREGSVEGGYGSDGEAWLLVGDRDGSAWKQRLPSDGAEEVLASWGVHGDLGMDPIFSSDTLGRYVTRSGTVPFRDGSVLKERSRSDVYVVSDGTALPVDDWDTYLLLGFGGRDILTVGDGLVAEVMGSGNVGSCAAGIRCLDAEAVTACGGGLELGGGESGGEEAGEEGEEEEAPVDEEESDVDGDGTPDADDNCPFHDNGDQGDVDGDGAGDACDMDIDGDGVSNADDCDLLDPAVGECGAEEEEEAAEGGETVETDEYDGEPSDYLWIDGDALCFSAAGFAFPYDAADAYLVGYGGRALALDFSFREDFRVSESGGAYCLDASALDFDDYEATLVSSLDASGGPASGYADTGDWWDNYDFCTGGSDAAAQFCAFQGGWNYLIAFSVTSSGIFPNGDGS